MGLTKALPKSVRVAGRNVLNGLSQRWRAVKRRVSRPNLYDLRSFERVGVVFTAPSDMRIDERLFLYSFVRGLRPQRVLEIGILAGGGGAIMANAMEENGKGIIVGVDPAPQIRVKDWQFHDRYKIIKQPSPQGIPDAAETAGGTFDFVLVDGLHRYQQVVLDIAAIKEFLTDGCYVLFHDAFHYGVAQAIKDAVLGDPRWTDCGYVCQTARIDNDEYTPYNGFRLLRFGGGQVVDSHDVVAPIYKAAGKEAPQPSPDMLDHDGWYCRAVEPCEKCIRTGRNRPKSVANETGAANASGS